jgi:hypothetical protein
MVQFAAEKIIPAIKLIPNNIEELYYYFIIEELPAPVVGYFRGIGIYC